MITMILITSMFRLYVCPKTTLLCSLIITVLQGYLLLYMLKTRIKAYKIFHTSVGCWLVKKDKSLTMFFLTLVALVSVLSIILLFKHGRAGNVSSDYPVV